MALHIIDRRLAGKNKSVGNRERFVRRFKEQIAEAVRKAVSSRDIRHIDQAENGRFNRSSQHQVKLPILDTH